MNWISAKDKLPEAGQSLLCVGAKGGYFLVIKMRSGDLREVKDGIGVWHGGNGWRTFTHWMVLPEPPERNGLLETGGDMNG